MKARLLKSIAVFLIITMVTQILYPTIALALTGGPSQPENQTFQPAGTAEMVDLFSGDFSYNIPLIDVGGYPINMGYNSSITMDQEASWCGLGWNINLGVINRTVRGVPDDFKGDLVKKKSNVKPNNTYGTTVGFSAEIFGVKGEKKGKKQGALSVNVGLSYNNYTGYGFEMGANPSISAANSSKGELSVGLGLSASSESGVGVTPSVSYTKKVLDKDKKEKRSLSSSIGAPFNSRAGLNALTVQAGVSMPSNAFVALGGRISHNGGGHISFASPAYTPQISMPMNSFGLTFSATMGAEIFGLHGNLEFGGYYSRQALAEKNRELGAYGYLFAHESEKFVRGNVMLDFNREKDGSFTKSTPNLALANHTYDVYAVAGQGVGGNYRPFRGDIGTVYDPYTTTTGNSAVLPGFEFGGGNAAHLGTNFTFVNTRGHSGRWLRNNDSKNFFAFHGKRDDDNLYEPVYFKQAGEKTVDTDPSMFNTLGGFDPVRVELGTGDPGSAKGNLINNANQKTTLATDESMRESRVRRNQVIGQLNAQEASLVGLEKKIISYEAGNFTMTEEGHYSAKTELNRKDKQVRRDHHMSEMTVARSDGARYVYGIPTYNKVQKEVSFAVASSPNCATGLVPYTSEEASTDNKSGLDNYFEEVTTPPYATSYLLTAIISPDYVDVEDDGPSDDDLGTYTKFNYSKIADDYKWRVPFEAGKANYSEGLKSDLYDDKGNYLYGEKELWYVHSIETKTHVTEFYLSNRDDGYGVINEGGGQGNQTMQKLDSIVLYSKPDRIKEWTTPGHKAVPIKKVHFIYDYSLCPGVPNNISGQGKLTLREVFFTYQHSKKGKFSPYRFHYEGENPSYNLKAYDRWGNFKPNAQGTSCGIEDVTAGEFPYVEQNKKLADLYSSAWHLTTIHLPSGGKIKVDFESDDYAYVQDRKAMQMFRIEGIGNSPSASPTSGRNLKENRFLFFKLSEPIPNIPSINASEYLKNNYLGDILTKTIGFRFFIDLNDKNNFDYVPGYAQVANAGVATASLQNGQYTYGYIELKGVGVETSKEVGDENPIQKAAWQFARLQRPEIVYGGDEPPGDANVIGIFKAIISAFQSILDAVVGINTDLRLRGFGENFIPHKSTIRLYNPTGFKYGGGSRVKRVAMSDEWAALSNNVDENTFQFGQEYSYTTTIGSDNSKRTISSGVASYEPILGGEENPFRRPVGFSFDRFLAPDDKYYMEEPFGEMFFPGPQVGYSKVIVRNLQHDAVKRTATGYVMNEFYTAKDFPTIVSQTSLAAKPYKPPFLLSFLKIKVREYMTASQGYVVEGNDMHGKQKAQWVYGQDKPDPISGVEYFYKTNELGNKLNNEVYTITKHPEADSKNIHIQNVGVDYDMIADMREQENVSVTSGLGGNLDTFLAALFPGVVPVVLPKYSKEEVRFRSVVLTKVIQRYGLIDKVVAHDLGSSVQTKNLMYDAETGEVLLTETQNQFNDPVYSFTYPAHWGYEGMGMAYKNLGLNIASNADTFEGYLYPGDEILTNNQRAWVSYASGNYVELMDKDGEYVEASGNMKVIRTGRRNQQSTPIGSVSSLKNPMVSTDNDAIYDDISFAEGSVLNASGVNFLENWQRSCKCVSIDEISGNQPVNRFFTGERGNWRLGYSYTFLTDRSHTRFNDNPDVRRDGTYKLFSPFWVPSGGYYDWNNNTYGWTLVSGVTIYNTQGNELENIDALNRYSAAIYGYNKTLPKAVGNNTAYKELGFDGFEDYDNTSCDDEHLNFFEFKNKVTEENAHSGRRSIKVAPNSSIEIIKDFACPEPEWGGGE